MTMASKVDPQTYLSAMAKARDDEPAPAERRLRAVPKTEKIEALAPAKPAPKTPAYRAKLKHFGGYLDASTLETVALLRARLGLDNSELIKLAIEELAKRHDAKRAFGDA